MSTENDPKNANVDVESTSIASTEGTEEAYPAFQENTHAWVIYGGKYGSKLSNPDRIIGSIILILQMLVYFVIWMNVIEEFVEDQVPVTIGHGSCKDSSEESVVKFLEDKTSLSCDAKGLNRFGLALALCMVSLFLTSDFQDAYISFFKGTLVQRLFSILVLSEVIAAMATSVVAATQKAYVGDITSSLEASVGLLFVHDIGGRVFLCVKKNSDGGRNYTMFLTSFIAIGAFAAVMAFIALGILPEWKTFNNPTNSKFFYDE